ncbi:MAG: universal stress protein [Bdellovibrionales bacterium]
MNTQNVIIWAVDPTQNPKDSKNIIKEMKLWSRALDCKILPVTVIPQPLFRMPIQVETLGEKSLSKIVEKSVRNFLAKANFKGHLPPQFISIPSSSRRTKASALAQFAERNGAQLIVSATSARKTWYPRIGGFAEALITISRTPVLLLNPQAKISPRISSVMFPTDFSGSSKTALMRLAPWLKKLNAKVLLYNQMETPFVHIPASGVYLPEYYQETLATSQEASRKKKANNWSKIIEEQGISVSSLVENQKSILSDDIISVANRTKAQLIAMPSYSSPIARAFLGSTAREVLLQAKCPVLIFYRPKALRPAKKEADEQSRAPFESSSLTANLY